MVAILERRLSVLCGSVVAAGLLAALVFSGCASTRASSGGEAEADEVVPAATWEESKEAVESLRRAVEASYDRERALAERLRQMEEQNRALSEELTALRAQSTANRAQLDSLDLVRAQMSGTPPPKAMQDRRLLVSYQKALALFRDRNYPEALDRFGSIISAAPYSQWADNAQYWRGECLYGMGKFRQALTEFTKVFAYEKTEKADDAQLKVARCYLALGDKERALSAFQKLLDEYPQSEYAATARDEMEQLRRQ